MTQPTPETVPATEPSSKRARLTNPFTKNAPTDPDSSVNTKSLKDKVKTGLAVVGGAALVIAGVTYAAKKKTGVETLEVTLPSIDTTPES